LRNAYKIFVGKPDAKRPLGRCWSRWEDIIRIDLREVGSGQEQVAVSCEHGNEPSGSVNCGEFLDQLSDLVFQEGPCYMESVGCFPSTTHTSVSAGWVSAVVSPSISKDIRKRWGSRCVFMGDGLDKETYIYLL